MGLIFRITLKLLLANVFGMAVADYPLLIFINGIRSPSLLQYSNLIQILTANLYHHTKMTDSYVIKLVAILLDIVFNWGLPTLLRDLLRHIEQHYHDYLQLLDLFTILFRIWLSWISVCTCIVCQKKLYDFDPLKYLKSSCSCVAVCLCI